MSTLKHEADQVEKAPLIVRVLQTPVGQLLRGRITGRVARPTDTPSELIQLPQPLDDLVKDIVKRTRLWRREKREVARELNTHFQDGLEAGVSPEQLIQSFGDSINTAKLIRRAAKRNRPLWWRAQRRAKQSVVGLVMILAAIYLYALILFWLGRPSPKHDYLADLNAVPASVSEEQRAWPVYRQALVSLGREPELPATIWPEQGDEKWRAWPEYLTAHQDDLQLVREAASRRNLGFVVATAIDPADVPLWPDMRGHPGEGLFVVLLPYLNELRRMSRVLHADAMQAAADGDWETFVADNTAIIGLADHAREHPVLIGDLVSFAILAIAFDDLNEVLHKQPQILTDGHLRDLAHRIASFAGGGVLRTRLEGERMFFRDFVQRAYTDNGRGDGRFTSAGTALFESYQITDQLLGHNFQPAAPLITLLAASRKDVMAEHDRIMDAMEANAAKPLWQWKDLADGTIERYMSSPWLRMRYAPIAFLTPAVSKAMFYGELASQRRDAILVVIALELHRRRYGAWPTSLTELAPALLPQVPIDRFDGQLIRYRLTDGKPLIYSVGTDRDDDGGEPPRDAAGNPNNDRAKLFGAYATYEVSAGQRDPSDGDWVLWPPVPPPPPSPPGPVSHMGFPSQD